MVIGEIEEDINKAACSYLIFFVISLRVFYRKLYALSPSTLEGHKLASLSHRLAPHEQSLAHLHRASGGYQNRRGRDSQGCALSARTVPALLLVGNRPHQTLIILIQTAMVSEERCDANPDTEE